MKRPLDEIGGTKSSAQMDAHLEVIEKLVAKGFKIKSQDTEKKEGFEGELISTTLITILEPPAPSLPYLRLEASEVLGKFYAEDGAFEPFDSPKFELKTYRRLGDIKHFNDPWEAFTL